MNSTIIWTSTIIQKSKFVSPYSYSMLYDYLIPQSMYIRFLWIPWIISFRKGYVIHLNFLLYLISCPLFSWWCLACACLEEKDRHGSPFWPRSGLALGFSFPLRFPFTLERTPCKKQLVDGPDPIVRGGRTIPRRSIVVQKGKVALRNS